MRIDAFSTARSGVQAAATRQAASAHNVANLTTQDFRPLRVTQSEQAGGGVEARVDRAPDPTGTDLVRGTVEQIQARTQFKASVAVMAVADETLGSLLDIFA